MNGFRFMRVDDNIYANAWKFATENIEHEKQKLFTQIYSCGIQILKVQFRVLIDQLNDDFKWIFPREFFKLNIRTFLRRF